MLARIEYTRMIMSDFGEFVKEETVQLPSKSALIRHAREVKKQIASECKYRTTGDVINYRIFVLLEDTKL